MNDPTTDLLTIELVPETCWYSNIRTNVAPSMWEKIKRFTFREAGLVCEVCAGEGPRHPLECHEVWAYEVHETEVEALPGQEALFPEYRYIQRLVRCIALCPACHEVKHIGFAGTQGRFHHAHKHLRRVNGWGLEEADAHIQEAFNTWRWRSRVEWELDISWLDGFSEIPTIFRKLRHIARLRKKRHRDQNHWTSQNARGWMK